MEAIFIKLLNMSLSAGWVILAVLLLRILLRKAPKTILCCLWILAGFRLVCPISVESALSLIPSAEPISQEILYDANPAIESSTKASNDISNPIFASSFETNPEDSMNPLQVILRLASLLWIAGVLVMLLYAFLSCLKLHRRVAASLRLKDNLWVCDNVKSPFIFGILFPRIYLPSHLEETQLSCIIAHEKAHLKRHDHWWKPLGFLLLSVYWFNPLCWAAYVLLCRDIELACDEQVIKSMKAEEKRNYAETLLSCGMPRHRISACPLAFGEVSINKRIRTVLNYKKPSFWISFASILACVIAALCFLTNPASEQKHFSQEYLADLISSMSGSDATIFALYESDTIPGKLIAGFQNGNKPGFAVFNCKDTQNSYDCTIKGFHTFTRDSIVSLTIGEDWGFDHSVTIVINRIRNLSRLQLQSGSMIQEASPGYNTAPSMIVFEWPELLSKEESENILLSYDTQIEEQLPSENEERLPSESQAESPQGSSASAAPVFTESYYLESAVSAAILEYCASVPSYGSQPLDDSLFRCESHRILEPALHTVSRASNLSFLTGSQDLSHETVVYLMAMYQVYRLSPEGIQEIVNQYFPAKLTFSLAGDQDYPPGQTPIRDNIYILKEFQKPEGAYSDESREAYEAWLRETFPEELAEEALLSLTSQSHIDAYKQACYAQAVAYGKLDTEPVIEKLFDTILSSSAGTASDPYTYLTACPQEYSALRYYGQYTLNYIDEALAGSSQSGLKEQLMKILQEELTH